MSSCVSSEKPALKFTQPNRTLPMVDDHSDRKSLDELMAKLDTEKKAKEAKTTSPKSSKYTQLSMSSYCVGTAKRRRATSIKHRPTSPKKPEGKRTSSRKNKKETSKNSTGEATKRKKLKPDKNENLPKLDGWLSKSGSNHNKIDIVGEKVKSKVKKESEVLMENKSGSQKLKRQSSGSFDKYGIHMPSFQDIVAYQKKLKADQKCLDSIHISEDSQDDFNIDEPEPLKIILDCKHLNKDEIKKAYKNNKRYVDEIFHGIRYSSRHERFQTQNLADDFTVNDLKYNTSTITFDYEQKRELLKRLRKQFDAEDGSSNQYFYKVLLPELCLKIFMDTHNMSCDEATTYLESRPVMVY